MTRADSSAMYFDNGYRVDMGDPMVLVVGSPPQINGDLLTTEVYVSDWRS